MSPSEMISVGGLVVALSGYGLNLRIDRKKRVAEQRAQAYINYLKAFVAMAYYQPGKLPSQDSEFEHLAARTELILFASKNVMKCLDELYRGPQQLKDIEAGKRFASLIAAMQRDACGFSSEIETILRTVVYPGKGKP